MEVEHSDQGKDLRARRGTRSLRVSTLQSAAWWAARMKAHQEIQNAEGSMSSLAERRAEPAKGTSLAQVSNDEVSKKVSLPSMVRGHRMQSSAALF
jgi:hypothetical protein